MGLLLIFIAGLVAEVATERTGLRPRRVAFVFNPSLLTREELRNLFVARHAERDQILRHLRAAGSSPQHSLLLGDRGMGKTTLLLRLAHSIDEEPDLRGRWLPVRFDEEQYNIGELADFWLNCLEKIGEDTGDPNPLDDVDSLVRDYRGAQLEEAAFRRLRQYSKQHNRRLLLLVDNLDLLLARLSRTEAHRLREVLQQESWVLLVGAATQPILETFNYDSPFYDFFHVIPLTSLSFEEMLDFLRKLGSCFRLESETTSLLEIRRDALEVLHTLIGGNLRTTTILFSLLQEDPSADSSFLLDRLLDQYTSSYKDAIETLPAQGQRIFDALARFWYPTTAEDVARELRIERGIASAQLHRLVERDLAVKVPLPQRSLGFQIRDRFFNLWYLMRGGRRQRQKLRSLLSFLSLFYRWRHPTRDSEKLVDKLKRLRLLSPETLADAEREAHRLEQQESVSQGALFTPAGPVSNRPYLLALCLSGQYERAEEQARDLLRFSPGDELIRTLLAYLLELRRDPKAALDILEYFEGNSLPAWVRLERARLSLEIGETEAAGRILMSLLDSNEILASEIATAAVALAQRKGDKHGWIAQGLVSHALERAPADPAVLLASCEIELMLDRPKKALEQLQAAFKATRYQKSRELVEPACFDMSLRLGARHSNEVLQILEETGFAEEWVPLSHALITLRDGPDALVKLSPEMRKFTEMVLGSLRENDQTDAITFDPLDKAKRS